ncbi:uncharacterized protein LOC144443827 [Glandiceps talaboti]
MRLLTRLRSSNGMLVFLSLYLTVLISFLLVTKMGSDMGTSLSLDTLRMWRRGDDTSLKDTFLTNPIIHVVTVVDATQMVGIPALINSILKSSKRPDDVRIHMVMCGKPVEYLEDYLRCYGLTVAHQNIEIASFVESQIDPSILLWDVSFYTDRSRSTCRYSYSYLDRLFPKLQRVIYVNSGAVVTTPIEALWLEALQHPAPLLGTRSKQQNYSGDHFNIQRISDMFVNRYHREFLPCASLFNDQAFVIDLEFYRRWDLFKDVEFWLEKNAVSSESLWKHISHPTWQLIYHGLWKFLDEKWSVMSWEEIKAKYQDAPQTLPDPGIYKPRLIEGANKNYWAKYRPPECFHKGRCEQHSVGNVTSWKCICESGWTGPHCQFKIGKKPRY